MASTAIPALPTLDMGSIQDLMTLPLHTPTPMASIHNSANLSVGWDSLEILILRDDVFFLRGEVCDKWELSHKDSYVGYIPIPLVANVLDVSWTCPGLVHLSLILSPTAIPQGHWVTWLLWVPCSVEVPESESWAIWLHQKWKLLHQMQIFCAAVSLYHSWMHRCSSTSLHWHLFYAFLYVLMLFIPSICTVYPLSCHMVSMSWNDH